MPILVAFASLPFGLREGTYELTSFDGLVTAHVSELRYNPFLTISSRPELAQALPKDGHGEGFSSYTWYDHPFVLRVTFGRNVASLGSINSSATIVRPLPDDVDVSQQEALTPLRDEFAEMALDALNNLIAIVRRKARLYHVFDLQRDDIDITVRNDDGSLLYEDPLQAELILKEEAESERFDLLEQSDEWYEELSDAFQNDEPLSLGRDLLIEAERALAQRFPRQAIATCYTAIEAAAAALLTHGMHRRGIPDSEIDYILSTRGLASKLAALLRTYTGFNLKHDNRPLWRAFNELSALRNDVVHRGGPARTEDAESAIEITRELLNWLDRVRMRNK